MGRPPMTETHHRRIRIPQRVVPGDYQVGDVVNFSGTLAFNGYPYGFARTTVKLAHTTFPHDIYWWNDVTLAEKEITWTRHASDQNLAVKFYDVDFSVTLNEDTVKALNTPDAGILLRFQCFGAERNNAIRTIPLVIHDFSVSRDTDTTPQTVTPDPIPNPMEYTAPVLFDLRTNPVVQGLTSGTTIGYNAPATLANAGISPIFSTATAEEVDGDIALRTKFDSRYALNFQGLRILTDSFPDVTPATEDTPRVLFLADGPHSALSFHNPPSKMRIGDEFSVKGKLTNIPAGAPPFEVVLAAPPSYGWGESLEIVIARSQVTRNAQGEFEFDLSGPLNLDSIEIDFYENQGRPDQRFVQRRLGDNTGVPHGSRGAYANTVFYRLAVQFETGVHVRIRPLAGGHNDILRNNVEILVTDFTAARPGWTSSTTLNAETTPNAGVNRETEVLTGLNGTYSFNGGSPVVVTGDHPISPEWQIGPVFQIVKKGDGVTTRDSYPQYLNIQRPKAPHITTNQAQYDTHPDSRGVHEDQQTVSVQKRLYNSRK
jgi:hypothetical protein